MTRRFTLVTLCLTGTITFLIGLIVAGSFVPNDATSEARVKPAPALRAAR